MIPQTVYCYFWAYPFLLFSYSVLHFLVVVSVRQIKVTHVGFREHVKIAFRIVSYRIVLIFVHVTHDIVHKAENTKRTASPQVDKPPTHWLKWGGGG